MEGCLKASIEIVMKVAAVFASFNRREVAMACLERLRLQSLPLDQVVVGDNASEDGSAEAMRELAWDALEVIDTGGNLGNAGAVRRAMDRAFELGMDAVWILDDDSWPREDALAALLEHEWEPNVVRHPLQIDPVTGDMTWPLQVIGIGGEVTVCGRLEELPDGARLASRGVWTGALIPRLVWETVGPVNDALFIRGEDEEYPWRIEQAGFKEEAVVAAVLDHPGPTDLIEWKLFGKRLFLERGLSDWKIYYKVRNMVWLRREQAGHFAALTMAVAYGLAIARTEGIKRIPVWWGAAVDGWNAKLGRKDFPATRGA
jgi:GT2 family glycosyltransferase